MDQISLRYATELWNHKTPANCSRNAYQNVVDDQSVDIQTLVFGVAFGVLQQLKQEVGGFLWPTSLSCSPLFGLSASADTTVEVTVWNTFLLVNDIFQESLCTSEWHFLDGLGGFMGILWIKQTNKKYYSWSRFLWCLCIQLFTIQSTLFQTSSLVK